MRVGIGRELKQESQKQISVRTMPLLGEKIHNLRWRMKHNDTAKAENQFLFACGRSGAGKTTLAKYLIDQCFRKGEGFLTMDAARNLSQFTIRRAAEIGWPTDRFFVLDFLAPSEFGYPVVDFLDTDPEDEYAAWQTNEDISTITAQASAIRSTAGPIQLDLGRKSFLPLILCGEPLGSIERFISDAFFRERIVKEAARKMDSAELINFWLGDHSYFKTLKRDALESLRNKFSPLLSHPAIKRVISQKEGTFPLYHFMQNAGVIVSDLNEYSIKHEIRLVLAQFIQSWIRANVSKRFNTTHRPFWMTFFDEFIQYRTSSMIDFTRLARQLQFGAMFMCQDLGFLTPGELRTLMANCATKIVFRCSYEDATLMAKQMLTHSDAKFKDWEERRPFILPEVMAAFIGLILQLQPGQSICQTGDSPEPHYNDVPEVREPRVSDRMVKAYLRDMAKKWYYKPKFMVG